MKYEKIKTINFDNVQLYVNELMHMFTIPYIDYDININGKNICMLFNSQYDDIIYRIFINTDLYIIIQQLDNNDGDCHDIISVKVDTSYCTNDLSLYFFKVAYTITALLQFIDK